MTSAGDGPPPLPPGHDPFEILGVAEDASEREIRKAYAKRIKQYRPDRSPAEFQRIQAAFEMLSSGRLAHDPAPASESPPAAEPVTIETAQRLSAHLAEAFAAYGKGDRATVDRIVAALLAERVPVELLLADPDYVPMILESSAISWSALDARDPVGRWALWTQAVERALVQDPARARAMIDDDALRADAADHRQIAVLLLLYLGGAGWLGDVGGRPALARYRAGLPSDPVVDHALDRAALDLNASVAARGQELPPVMRPLIPLIIAARIAGAEEQDARARELVHALASDVNATLAQIDAWIAKHGDLRSTLHEVIAHDLPERRRRLDRLSPRRFAHLTRKLHAAGKRERSLWGRAAGVAIGIGVLGAVVPALALVASIMVGAYLVLDESGLYVREMRQRVARAILAAPVDSWTVARWIKLNRKLNGRLGRFDAAIDADDGLYLFSFLVAYATEVGELDRRLDRDD